MKDPRAQPCMPRREGGPQAPELVVLETPMSFTWRYQTPR